MRLGVVILAAGQGTRMKSKTQKILHDVGGKPMVQHVFEAAQGIADVPPVLVIGPGENGVQALFGETARYVEQSEQLGTGHATMMAKPLLQGQTELVIVTYGDMPLLRSATLAQLAQMQGQSKGVLTMLAVTGDTASSFGRLVRDEMGLVQEIVEVAEAQHRPNTEDLLAITELNAGVYCFDSKWLWANIENLPLRQARSGQEYYLTDMVNIAVEQGRQVEALIVADQDECLGAGTRQEMVAVERAFRRRANAHWMKNGVTLLDPNTVYIDQDVFIGQDSIIWPNTYIQGNSHIGEACIIGPNSIIRNAQIGSNCRIEAALVENTCLKDGTYLAPFTVIRNNSETNG